MKRDIYQKLLDWQNSNNRKPLIIKGARQVGKTYLVKEFGKCQYADVAYFNFEEDPNLKDFFQGKIDPLKIIEKLSIAREAKILPEKTLIVFDEIQEEPRAITSLKYFNEICNEYHLVVLGSLLGLKLGQDRSFPVGKVNVLKLLPFSFYEYLTGIGKPLLRKLLQDKKDFNELDEKFHEELIDNLKMYFYIGGMPEAIKTYLETKDLAKVRKVQNEILLGYASDFAKHTTKQDAIKIANIWNNIPAQLARENKKFTYSLITKHARHRDYAEALEWLISVGVVYKVMKVSTANLPLSGYAEENIFKLYLLDIGLLGAMLNLSQKTIIEKNELFSRYNGAFTESYVAQELMANDFTELYYWANENSAEVDFVISDEDNIYPLEVKAGENTKAKSLKVYYDRYKPENVSLTSQINFRKKDYYRGYPLYAVALFPDKNS